MDALLEIGLGLAGHHRGQMKDDVGTAGDGGACRRGIGDIGGAALDVADEFFRLLRRHDIDQRQLLDGAVVERPGAGADQPRSELAPDHSRGAGDEDVHRPIPVMPEVRAIGAPRRMIGRGALAVPFEARGACHRAGHFGPDPLARTSG